MSKQFFKTISKQFWAGFNLNAMLLENGYTVTTYKQGMYPEIPGNLGAGAVERSLLAADDSQEASAIYLNN